MNITIDFLQNKKILVAGVEKEIKEVSYIDESGNSVNATIWRFDKDNVEFPNWSQIAPGSTIEANPWNKPGSDKITLYAPKIMRTKASTFGNKPKVDVEGRLKVQEEITKNVKAAQDRTAWMYAKNNAATLLANIEARHEGGTTQEIANEVIDLATKIYNGEPTSPF